MANFTDELRRARVLHEDSEYITIEVAKHDSTALSKARGDRFLTMLFITVDHDEELVVWRPWELEG